MFGQRLTEVRKDAHDRQEDMAAKLSVSKFAVQSWEQNKSYPSIDTLIKICEIYKVSADYMLGIIPWDAAHEATYRDMEFTIEEHEKIKEFEKFIIFQRRFKKVSGSK